MTTTVGLASVDAYVRALPEDSAELTIEKVEWGEFDEAVWIVTTVRAKGKLRAFRPLYVAEMAAHDAGGAAGETALIFRIIELDLDEELHDGPRVLCSVVRE